jgi:hypothetical protein
MKMAVFWVVAPCIRPDDETARTSETLVNFFQTIQRNNPEDSHLRTHRRENLKSHGNEPSCSIKDDEFLDQMSNSDSQEEL